jgi:hypothetical protein
MIRRLFKTGNSIVLCLPKVVLDDFIQRYRPALEELAKQLSNKHRRSDRYEPIPHS